jgi:hypothetical protein
MKRQTHTFASGRLILQEVPQVSPEVSGVRAATRGSFATEEIMLNTTPTAFNRRVPPSCARGGHGDGHLTVWPRTQTMHWKRVPVYRAAVREFAREGTEEREHHSSARVQEPQQWGALNEFVLVGGLCSPELLGACVRLEWHHGGVRRRGKVLSRVQGVAAVREGAPQRCTEGGTGRCVGSGGHKVKLRER